VAGRSHGSLNALSAGSRSMHDEVDDTRGHQLHGFLRSRLETAAIQCSKARWMTLALICSRPAARAKADRDSNGECRRGRRPGLRKLGGGAGGAYRGGWGWRLQATWGCGRDRKGFGCVAVCVVGSLAWVYRRAAGVRWHPESMRTPPKAISEAGRPRWIHGKSHTGGERGLYGVGGDRNYPQAGGNDQVPRRCIIPQKADMEPALDGQGEDDPSTYLYMCPTVRSTGRERRPAYLCPVAGKEAEHGNCEGETVLRSGRRCVRYGGVLASLPRPVL